MDKEKVVGFFGRISVGIENGIKAIVSKRVYVIALLTYLGITAMEPVKFCALCAVAIAFIISEDRRKLK